MSSPTLKPRIVLIEDDWGRIETFKQWLAKTEFILVVTHSGGQALGMLRKGSTEAVAGMLLDHDLSDAPLTDVDHRLSTSDIIPLIQRSVRRTVPILIHSHNMNKPVTMQRALESSGFSVTRIRFGVLSEERFMEWLEEVRDNWEPPE